MVMVGAALKGRREGSLKGSRFLGQFNGESGFMEPTPINWDLRLHLVWYVS